MSVDLEEAIALLDEVDVSGSGLYEIGEDYDEVGRRPRLRGMLPYLRARRRGPVRRPVVDPVRSRGIQLRPKPPQPKRQLIVPVRGAADTPAGTTQTIEVSPQTYFMPKFLRFSASTAASFVITNVNIGRSNQLAATSNGWACDTFAGDQGVRVEWDTAEINQPITFTFENVGAADARFALMMVGFSIG